VSDGVVDAIAGPPCGGESFVANVEVQVLGATLPRQVTARACAASQEGWLVCNRRTARAGAAAAVGPRVAMAVGKTKDGESLPAKPGGHCYYRRGGMADGTRIPSFEYPVPLQACVSTQSQCKGLAHRQLASQGAYLSMTTAGVWDAIAGTVNGTLAGWSC
jgi:hypothetical protein